jgi:hypothetical protein
MAEVQAVSNRMILPERRVQMVTDSGNQASLGNALCEAYRGFERLGLSSGTAGNVSVRWSSEIGPPVLLNDVEMTVARERYRSYSR